MNIKLDENTPPYVASLFIFLIREGITPHQLMVGIVRLATDTQDLAGMIASADCLRCLLGETPIENTAEGITEFIASLALSGVTTLMLLDALGIACHQCRMANDGSIIRFTYHKLQEDTMISKVLDD